MSFSEAIKTVFSKYAVFTGRARRSEYWYFFLFNVIVSAVLSALAKAVPFLGFLSAVYALAALLPGIGVFVRRMHDVGRSGWSWLFGLIPLVGAILLLVWSATDSQPGDNKYGPNPKMAPVAAPQETPVDEIPTEE